MRALSFLPLLLLACSGDGSTDGDEKDSKNPEEQAVQLTLLAPEDGMEYAAEEAVPLHVEAKRNGNPVSIESATWTISGWTGNGKETEATGLASGPHTVTVEAVVGGDSYTASVDITVAEPVQTLWAYSGTLEADVIAETDFGDYDDHCSTPITFSLDSGVIAGNGTCVVFEDFDLDPLNFAMEGTVRGGNVAGDLVMSFDGNEARTPFAGTGNAGSPLTASFDTTHRSGDGSVRIVGTWTATPQ